MEVGVEGRKVVTVMKFSQSERVERWQRHMQRRWLKIKFITIRRVIVN